MQLQRTLGPVQFFSIGFGAIVGVGWIVLMGVWFTQAGPVGTAVAFAVGGVLVAVVGLCYAEMATMMPVAGGEAAYAYGSFGSPLAFLVGWFLVLMNIAVVPYVSIALAWILDVLVPGFAGPTLYEWRGTPVRLVSLGISLLWTLWLGLVNYRGIRSAARFQDWFTYSKLAISVLFFAAGLFGGSTANLEPGFVAKNGSIWAGVMAVLVVTPWFFGGFNQIPQVMEEKAPGASVTVVGKLIVVSILVAAVYYCLAALATGMAGPWQRVVDQDLPAAAAFRLAFGSELFAKVVLVAGLFGIVTVGNSCSLAATRLLFAMSRARFVTGTFERLHPVRASPVPAIVLVTAFALLGNFMGRNGIAAIVNVGSICGALAYAVTCFGVIRLRRTEPRRSRPYRMPAGIALASVGGLGSLFLLVSALRQQYMGRSGVIPMEWVVLITWGLIGFGLWRGAAGQRQAIAEDERRRIVFGGGQLEEKQA